MRRVVRRLNRKPFICPYKCRNGVAITKMQTVVPSGSFVGHRRFWDATMFYHDLQLNGWLAQTCPREYGAVNPGNLLCGPPVSVRH